MWSFKLCICIKISLFFGSDSLTYSNTSMKIIIAKINRYKHNVWTLCYNEYFNIIKAVFESDGVWNIRRLAKNEKNK